MATVTRNTITSQAAGDRLVPEENLPAMDRRRESILLWYKERRGGQKWKQKELLARFKKFQVGSSFSSESF